MEDIAFLRERFRNEIILTAKTQRMQREGIFGQSRERRD